MAATLGSTAAAFTVAHASSAQQHTPAPAPRHQEHGRSAVHGGGAVMHAQARDSALQRTAVHVPWRTAPGHTTLPAAPATGPYVPAPVAQLVASTQAVAAQGVVTARHTRPAFAPSAAGAAALAARVRQTTHRALVPVPVPTTGLSRRAVVAARPRSSTAPSGAALEMAAAQAAAGARAPPPAQSFSAGRARVTSTVGAAAPPPPPRDARTGAHAKASDGHVIYDDDTGGALSRTNLTSASIRDVVERARGPKRRRLTPVVTGACIGCRSVKSLKYSVPARLLKGVRVPPHQCCRQCWLFLRRHFWLDRNQPHVHCRNKARFHCRERLHKFALPLGAHFRCHFVSTNVDGMVVGIGATSDEEVTIAPPPGSRPAPPRVLDDDTYGLGSGDKVRPHHKPRIATTSGASGGARSSATQARKQPAAAMASIAAAAAGQQPRAVRQLATAHPLEDPHQPHTKSRTPATWATRGRTVAAADRRRKRARSSHGSPRVSADPPPNIEAAASNLCAAGAKARNMAEHSTSYGGAKRRGRSTGAGGRAAAGGAPAKSNKEETAAAAALAWLASMPGCAGVAPRAATTQKSPGAQSRGTTNESGGRAGKPESVGSPERRSRNSSQDGGEDYDDDTCTDDAMSGDAGLVMQTPWSNGAKPRERVRLFDMSQPLDSITFVSLRARLKKMVHEHPGRKLGRYYGALKWCCKNCRTIFKDRAKPFRLPKSDVRHVLRLLRLQACYDVGMRGSDSTGNTTNHNLEAPPAHDGVECAAGKRMWELLAAVKPRTYDRDDNEVPVHLRAAAAGGGLVAAYVDVQRDSAGGEVAHA